jgi:hypothetical protein
VKVTVELTDEQADRFGNGNYYCDAQRLLGDAIVSARPKPLKVGDKVYALMGSTWWYTVIAIGTAPDGQRWLVGQSRDEGSVISLNPHKICSADGSPIVWPE